MYSPPYLQKYSGLSTRHTCPGCEHKQCFTLYLDGNTNEPINSKVGICNRESKCGYHYTPKQFFIDNPSPFSPPLGGGWVGSNLPYSTNVDSRSTPSPLGRAGVGFGTIPFSFVQNSASYKSNFVRFLCEILTVDQMTAIGENYALGATKTDEVIFWQIDMNGKVRTGKIMQYNPITGRRQKHESGAIDWVHNKLKKTKHIPEDFNLQQCFFGEHLLKLYPDKTVAIVESEKSALIASAIFPDLVWLGAGNMNGLSIEKCQVIQNRTVILFPDLNAFDKWSEKAQILNALPPSPQGEGSGVRFKINVSTLLEDIATPAAKEKGLDVADFMIDQLLKKMALKSEPIPTPVIQSRFTPELDTMIETNHALLILIDKLDLKEV